MPKEYTLSPPLDIQHTDSKQRIVPPRRPLNLRRGGGRKDTHGWTEQKRKSNRLRFDELRPFIKTGVTICYPANSTPEELATLNECNRNFCKEHRLPARSVWEGPGFHQHIALGIAYDQSIEDKWRARLQKSWLKTFGQPMLPSSFLWKPDEEPDKIASYLSKTEKNGKRVKGAFGWLTFCPVWETGFQSLVKAKTGPYKESETPRKKSVNALAILSPEKERHANSPRYTVHTPEKESEPKRLECEVCRTRWGRSLWAGSCICTGDVERSMSPF